MNSSDYKSDNPFSTDEQADRELPGYQRDIFKNPAMIKKVNEILRKNGLPVDNPVLRLDLQTQQGNQTRTFEMEQEDLLKTFGYFGKIRDIKIFNQTNSPSYALIYYDEIVNAFYAQ